MKRKDYVYGNGLRSLDLYLETKVDSFGRYLYGRTEGKAIPLDMNGLDEAAAGEAKKRRQVGREARNGSVSASTRKQESLSTRESKTDL